MNKQVINIDANFIKEIAKMQKQIYEEFRENKQHK